MESGEFLSKWNNHINDFDRLKHNLNDKQIANLDKIKLSLKAIVIQADHGRLVHEHKEEMRYREQQNVQAEQDIEEDRS